MARREVLLNEVDLLCDRLGAVIRKRHRGPEPSRRAQALAGGEASSGEVTEESPQHVGAAKACVALGRTRGRCSHRGSRTQRPDPGRSLHFKVLLVVGEVKSLRLMPRKSRRAGNRTPVPQGAFGEHVSPACSKRTRAPLSDPAASLVTLWRVWSDR